jgi:ATP-binding cassette, subfamily B, multidrug efflux pump
MFNCSGTCVRTRLSITVTLVLVFASAIAELSLPAMMATIVDQGVAKGDVASIWKTGGTMLIVAFAASWPA